MSKLGISQYSIILPFFRALCLPGACFWTITIDGRVPMDFGGAESSRLQIKWCRIRGSYHFEYTETFLYHWLGIKCRIPVVSVLKNGGGGGGEGWNSCAFKCAQWLGENWLVFPRWLCFKTLSGFKTFAVKEYQWYLLSISVGFSVLMYQGRSGHFAVLNSVEHCRSRRMQIVFLYLHHVLTVAAP